MRNMDYFKELDSKYGEIERKLNEVQAHLHLQHVQKGKTMVQIGDPVNAFYIVVYGELTVLAIKGKQQIKKEKVEMYRRKNQMASYNYNYNKNENSI